MQNTLNTNFITNQEDNTLEKRFKLLLKDSKNFDILVGYFYLSGFKLLYKELATIDKIRILVGIATDKQINDINNELLDEIKSNDKKSIDYLQQVEHDVAMSEDDLETYQAINLFKEWLTQSKIEIKLYTQSVLHSKVYIASFKDGDRDPGRVITGSSNLTKPGISGNIEFNVELERKDDYYFALSQFNSLWEQSDALTNQIIETIDKRTWIGNSITPYELYLKFLYEYFREELEEDNSLLNNKPRPVYHKDYEYQHQAVISAKRIIEAYGGVFIADVVGLGKTVMGALLLQEFNNELPLVICPPHLISSWQTAFEDYGILGSNVISLGSLDRFIEEKDINRYKIVLIDEAHRFRNEGNSSYAPLSRICRGKKVILLSATPYNNNPTDLLALVKLFQSGKDSIIPNLRDIEGYLNKLHKKIKELKQEINQEKDKYKQAILSDNYYKELKKIGRDIRERLLKYVMIRRTRDEIEKYYANDNLVFPRLHEPKEIYYQLDVVENKIFMDSLLLIKNLHYTRYKVESYLKTEISSDRLTIMNNLAGLMRNLLVKRLESSQYALKITLDRFIDSHRAMQNIAKIKGKVYVSKKYTQSEIEDLLDNADDSDNTLFNEQSSLTNKLIEYNITDFKDSFLDELQQDLMALEQLKELWNRMRRDPKLDGFKLELAGLVQQHKKILIFSESTDTARYLRDNLQSDYRVLLVDSSNAKLLRPTVESNFSTDSIRQDDDYDILVTSDVLAEGISLQRSNLIINYDLPWNPTKIMQRIGRINRVNTKFKDLYVYNFFPSDEGDSSLDLTNNSKTKITVFIELLGIDTHTLTSDEDVGGRGLFDTKSMVGDDVEMESELKFLRIIQGVKQSDATLFARIKKLPPKCNTIREYNATGLLSYFRQGMVMKTILTYANQDSIELSFFDTANALECTATELRLAKNLDDIYFSLFEQNRAYYKTITTISRQDSKKDNKSPRAKLLAILRAIIRDTNNLSNDDREYWAKLRVKLERGDIPKNTAKNTLDKIDEFIKSRNMQIEARQLIELCRDSIALELLDDHLQSGSNFRTAKTDIILAEYFTTK